MSKRFEIESIKLKDANTHETVLELEVPTIDIGFETVVDDEWLERLRVRGSILSQEFSKYHTV